MNIKKALFAIFSSLVFLTAASPAFAACSLSSLSSCDNAGLIALITQLIGKKANANSGITVTLSPTNPLAGIVLTGQIGADLVEYTFSNSSASDVTVKLLTLARTGSSFDSTLSDIYLVKDSEEIPATVLTSSGSFSFNKDGGLFVVPAGGSVNISVMATIAENLNTQSIGLSLSSISSDGKLLTNLPVAGNLFNITNVSLASATIPGGTQGSPSSIVPSKDANIDPAAGVTVWEGSMVVSNGIVEFSKLYLKQEGTIDAGDIGNFQLLIDNEEVATADSIDSNGYVNFDFDQFLTTGTKDIKVVADITGGSSKTIKMVLEQKGDISVKDSQYGVNVFSMPGSLAAATLTLNGGKIDIASDDSKLPSTIVNNSAGVLIGRFLFTAVGESIKLNSLEVGFDYGAGTAGSNSAATLQNGTVIINGIKQGKSADLKSVGTDYPINYTFQPGVGTPVEIYADINDDDGTGKITDGDTIAAELLKGTGNAVGQTSGSKVNVPDSDPALKETEAAEISIGNGIVTLSKTDNYEDQTASIPQSAYKIASFVLTAGNAEGFNIGNFKVSITGKSSKGVPSFDANDLHGMYIAYSIDGAASVTSLVKPSPSPVNNFLANNAVVPQGKSVIISVYSDIMSGGITTGDQIQTSLQVSGSGTVSNTQYNNIGGDGMGLAGQTITAVASSLAVVRDQSTPSATLAYAGQTLNGAAYKFTADDQGYTVTQIAFKIVDPSALRQVNLKMGDTVIQTRQPSSEIIFSNFANPVTIAAKESKVFTAELVLNNSFQSGTNLTTALSLERYQDQRQFRSDKFGGGGHGCFRQSHLCL